jgi:hypothetical protein
MKKLLMVTLLATSLIGSTKVHATNLFSQTGLNGPIADVTLTVLGAVCMIHGVREMVIGGLNAGGRSTQGLLFATIGLTALRS